MRRVLLFLLLLLPNSAADLDAQTAGSSDGLDFFVSYIKPTLWRPQVSVPVYALIGAYQDDSVTISYFDPNGVESVAQRLFIKSHAVQQVQLDPARIYAMIDSRPSYAACLIHGKAPITVQLYSEGSNGSELYLALPRTLLGTKYVVSSYANNAPLNADPESRSVFQIIATKSNTKVHLDLTAATTSPLPDTIVMQRGEVLRVRAARAYVDDLTGSIVSSNFPVAVISGHEGAALPGFQGIADWKHKMDDIQNMLIEQLIPAKDWTTEGLFGLPFIPEYRDFVPRDTGDMYREYSLRNQSTSHINSAITIRDTAWSAPFLELPFFDYPLNLSAEDSQKVALCQYNYYEGTMNSLEETFGYSVPVMMDIIPQEKWKEEYLWRVPSNSDFRGGQLLTLIYDRSSQPQIELDGRKLAWTTRTHTTWVIPGHPELAGVTFHVASGAYFATASKPFIVYSYGNSVGNLKVNAGYAAPCGTLGTEERVTTTLTVDSTCGDWSGVFVDSQSVSGDGTRFTVFTDSSILKQQRAIISTNIAVTIDSVNEMTWDYSIAVIDRLKNAQAALYLEDRDGLHLEKMLRYNAPVFRTLSGINIKRSQINSDTCADLVIVNMSDSNSYSLDNVAGLFHGEFKVSSVSPALPKVFAPHDTLRITMCMRTSIPDSTLRDTLTLSNDCYAEKVPISLYAIAPRVNWLIHDTTATLVCGDPDTLRMWLVNDNLKDGSEIIYNVSLQGPDAPEFSIVANQLGYANLQNFPLDPGQRIWFDVAFTPDMAKPIATRWVDRHARLVALSSLNTSPEIALTTKLSHPALAISAGSVDLGRTLVPANRQQTLVLSDTGDAPLIIRSISIGNPKITISGLTTGDTIYPGGSVTITITGSSDTPDSIYTNLHLEAEEECANPIIIPITFVPYAPPYHGPHITTTDLSLPAQYTCTRGGAELTIMNDGADTASLTEIELIGDPAITFADGSTKTTLRIDVTPDSIVHFKIVYKLTSIGSTSAVVRYTWDSSGVTVYTYSTLTLTGVQAVTAINVEAPIALYGSTASSTIDVPVILGSQLPPALGATEMEITLRYRRDLFHYSGIVTQYAEVTAPSASYDGNGNEILNIHLRSLSRFVSGEALRLKLEVLVANDTTSSIELLTAQFFGSTTADTLCVDYTTNPAHFTMIDLCADDMLRKVLRGQDPFYITAISPNPAQQKISITVHSIGSHHLMLQVFDLFGTSVLKQEISLPSGDSNVPIDLQSLRSGVFQFMLSDGVFSQQKRVILVR